MNTFSIGNVLKKNVMTIALFVIYVFFIIGTGGNMFTPSNVTSLIEQNAYVYILGVGMLMCMLTGGNIDLSVGSFVCFMGAVAGVFSVIKYVGTPLTLFIVIGVGLVYGAVLGFLIAYLKIPPWIATLAGYLAFRGLGTQILITVSETSAISNFPESFTRLFTGKIFESPWGELNIPCVVIGSIAAAAIVYINLSGRARRIKKGYSADPMWFVIVKSVLEVAVILILTFKLAYDGGIPVVLLWIIAVLIIYGIITEKTTIGRHFMTVGGNAETARLSGINNKLIMFAAYLNMSVLTVLAALIVTTRFGSANAFAGQNYEMDAIAACIVGGVSAYGGSGTVMGMVIGATLIGVINQGMSLMTIDQDWIKIAKGAVLLIAVVFDILSKKGNKRQ
ncbi:MAG: sugar ABC transporter permease [Ruminococcaceae bacterium]|jgi:putative multiple sugar transport system permease protein|nr:sugar ABC transporter permease [Oscillospiraceae bacterium]MBR2598745.1 sugar ABC transporter permease [Clostridiales bacterium]